MTGIVATGWGVLGSAGIGQQAWVDGVRTGGVGDRTLVDELDGEPLPAPTPHALTDFDRKAVLGRKGTRFFNRVTSFALTTCGEALRDSGIRVDETTRTRTGITLGTTLGSFRSTSDYSRETMEQDKPYMVNPVLFPNTVMNCASGQAAIWFGLKGANATIAGEHTAFAGVLRYAVNAIRSRCVDAMLAGSVEELSSLSGWLARHTRTRYAGPAGEGGAVLALESATTARSRGGRTDAELLAVVTGFTPRRSAASSDCVRRALAQAGVSADGVALLATSGPVEDGALEEVVRRSGPHRLDVSTLTGECLAASGALQAATVLALHRDDPGLDGKVSLLVGCDPDGAAAAAVLRGWSRAGDDPR